jgi:very-short-patch-repair endonuclease
VCAAPLGAAGLTKDGIQRRLKSGRLHRLHRGVYAVGHVALTQRSWELAAVLACGPDAVLSHRSAGRLWGLVRSAPAIEVTAPRSREARAGLVLHRSRRLDPDDRATRNAIPVTSVARTLVDLAEVLSTPRLADAVHEAEVQRTFDLQRVRETLSRLPGRAGEPRLRRVLATYDVPGITRSEAERRFLRLCAIHGLPRPEANVSIAGHQVDFLWRAAALAVEVDGAAAHHTRRAFERDRRRDRTLATHGIHVVRVTWRDLTHRPRALAEQLAAILSRR